MFKKKGTYIVAGLLVIGALLLSVGMSHVSTKSSNGTVKNLLSVNTVYAQALNEIETDMTNLMSEIEKAMKEQPELAMQGCPMSFIKNSDNYKKIVNLGLEAVKPLYDTLYEHKDAGLYEYILALAIEEITQENFVYNAEYGWKNSLEFRLAFEERVNTVAFNVERIMNDTTLDDAQKVEKLKEQGVFAVSSLIKEYNKTDSKVPKAVIEEAVYSISSKYNVPATNQAKTASTGNEMESFITSNKELFDSLVDLNGKAYQ